MNRTRKLACLTVLLGVATAVALLIGSRGTPLQGRYLSHGEILQADGSRLSQFHSVLFSEKRFYALSRIGAVQVETSGSVTPLDDGQYRLHVTEGNITGAPAGVDDVLRFNLLYARNSGSTLHLVPVHGCLLSQETQQIYCQSDVNNSPSRH